MKNVSTRIPVMLVGCYSHTLKYFPLTMLAFQIVLDDQPYPPHMNVYIDGSTKVPTKLLAKFTKVERALCKLYGKTIKDLKLDKAVLRQYTQELALTNSAFECAVMPVDDTAEIIYTAAGVSKQDAKIVDKMVNEFFDGKLRDVFQRGHF